MNWRWRSGPEVHFHEQDHLRGEDTERELALEPREWKPGVPAQGGGAGPSAKEGGHVPGNILEGGDRRGAVAAVDRHVEARRGRAEGVRDGAAGGRDARGGGGGEHAALGEGARSADGRGSGRKEVMEE